MDIENKTNFDFSQNGTSSFDERVFPKKAQKNYKPDFELNKLNSYFSEKIIEYDRNSGEPFIFNLDVLYDDSQNFWKQNGVKYELVDDTDVINHFKSYFSNNSYFLNSGVKTKVLEAYRQYGRHKYKKLLDIPKDCIVFNNRIIYVGNNDIKKVFDYNTLDIVGKEYIDNGYTFRDSNLGLYFITNPIPYEYNLENRSCPKIHKLFCELVGENNVENLYEIIGYGMLPDNPLQVAIILNGYGSNGKTTFCKITEKTIGKENCTSTDIYTLTETNFGVAPLFKKLVCFIGETDGHRLDKTSIIKRLTGEDSVPAQFKNKPVFTFRNYAKIIISTNTIPQTSDKSDGFYRRWLIVDFPNQFKEKKDVLSDIPESEYEALANICIDKLKQILKQKRFTNEPSIEEKRRIYEEKSNPLQTFLKEQYVITENPEHFIFCYEFYNKYETWARKHGYSIIPSQKAISTEIHEMNITSDRRIDYSREDKPRYYAFTGIKEKDIKENIEPEISVEKKYNKNEIIDYFVSIGKIESGKYNEDDTIRILKKNGMISEPENGVYKIYKGV